MSFIPNCKVLRLFDLEECLSATLEFGGGILKGHDCSTDKYIVLYLF